MIDAAEIPLDNAAALRTLAFLLEGAQYTKDGQPWDTTDIVHDLLDRSDRFAPPSPYALARRNLLRLRPLVQRLRLPAVQVASACVGIAIEAFIDAYEEEERQPIPKCVRTELKRLSFILSEMAHATSAEAMRMLAKAQAAAPRRGQGA